MATDDDDIDRYPLFLQRTSATATVHCQFCCYGALVAPPHPQDEDEHGGDEENELNGDDDDDDDDDCGRRWWQRQRRRRRGRDDDAGSDEDDDEEKQICKLLPVLSPFPAAFSEGSGITFAMFEEKINSPEVREYFSAMGLDILAAFASAMDIQRIIHEQPLGRNWLIRSQGKFHTHLDGILMA
ncbi:hypothetical protein AK812_SmicGene22078 [Symbiodinium microadriaticum]|uniref:Uncharacterized protein n=1 Tax=Symbiodinium microadriaticum TaxID=2951 RepID=A0A1Q9DKQ6_SYMMI|nr:hypothetical protein AK812_SmicGene22078 [Symbiodinium microadriaticum]